MSSFQIRAHSQGLGSRRHIFFGGDDVQPVTDLETLCRLLVARCSSLSVRGAVGPLTAHPQLPSLPSCGQASLLLTLYSGLGNFLVGLQAVVAVGFPHASPPSLPGSSSASAPGQDPLSLPASEEGTTCPLRFPQSPVAVLTV